ncbi:hypothetical protein ACF0H5_018755 [Mactra antiquata]
MYAPFMAKLSSCIFKVDTNDYALLKRAKKEEMKEPGFLDPSDEDVTKRLSPEEISSHCKRATRGTEETTRLITELLTSLDGETDGVLLDDEHNIHIDGLRDADNIYVKCKNVDDAFVEIMVLMR